MLNHDIAPTGWDASAPHTADNTYLNPHDMFDQRTHVGRENLADAAKTVDFRRAEIGDTKHAKSIFILVAIFMVVIFFIAPGHS